MFARLFRTHPQSVGESYLEHLARASGFGLRMVGGGLACIAHGLFPFWFTHTGSDTVKALNDELSGRRARAARSSGARLARGAEG